MKVNCSIDRSFAKHPLFGKEESLKFKIKKKRASLLEKGDFRKQSKAILSQSLKPTRNKNSMSFSRN